MNFLTGLILPPLKEYCSVMANYIYTTSNPTVLFASSYNFVLPQKGKIFNSEFLTITDNAIIISSFYSWDGCSPKWKFGNSIIGTPDFGDYTHLASLVHDALYQYSGQHHLTRDECDLIFFKLMQYTQFKYAKLYYRAVRLLGGFFWKHSSV